jgi:hypothetical protein
MGGSTCTGDEGQVCGDEPCCNPDEFPLCFIGTAGCCGGGDWVCPNGFNPVDCGDAGDGLVCEEPPPDDCCQPDEAPPCMMGDPFCCDGGFFVCPEDGIACIPGISCDAVEPV